MSYFKIALIVLQLGQKLIAYMEKQGIIKDEQRRELLRQMQLAADAVVVKERNVADAIAKKGKDLDDALAGDFRD